MSNIIYPIKFCKNKAKHKKVCVAAFNTETKEIEFIDSDTVKFYRDKTSFDFDTWRYNSDDIKTLGEKGGVVVYNDIHNNLYGIVTYSTYAQIWWVPKQNLTLDNMGLDRLLNFETGLKHGTLTVVKDLYKTVGYRVKEPKCSIKNSLDLNEFHKLLTSLNGHRKEWEFTANEECSKEYSEECSKVAVNDEVVNSEECSKDIAEENANPEKLDTSNIEGLVSSLVKRELNLINKEKELEAREQALNIKESELNTKQEEHIEIEESEGLVEDTSYKFNDTNKNLYELIIKTMKRGDKITLPFSVYKELRVSLKATLENNSSYTSYTSLANIGFESTMSDSVFGVIEVNEENPVKLTILEERRVGKIQSSLIQKYINDYRQWKRMNSYIK